MSLGILNYFTIYFCCLILSTASFLLKLAIRGREIAAPVYPKIITNWDKLLMESLGKSYFYSCFCCFSNTDLILKLISFPTLFPLLA